MKGMFYIWRYSIFTVLFLFSSLAAWAQNVVFSAAVSANKLGVEDQLQVNYTIKDAQNLQSITRVDFPDFEVLGGPFQGQSSNISISGNKMVRSSTITHSYILKPRKTGKLTIPPASARDAAGNTYESNSVTIEVVDGSLAPAHQAQPVDPFDDPFVAMMRRRQQAYNAARQQRQQQHQQPQAQQPGKEQDISRDLFIKVSVDKQKAYIGEQITANYKLYARIPMNVGISKLPSLNGFWTQDFEIAKGNVRPTEEIVNGQRYQVFLLKKSALFPQQTGKLTLDPAEAEGTARIVTQVRQRNPFGSLFDDPFFNSMGSLLMSDPFFDDDFFSTAAYRDIPVHLKSKPLTIEVLPLPEQGKPENFTGAVGDFRISSRLDKNTLTTDDALTYTVTITGSGNLKLFEVPKLDLPNGLTSYDPLVIDTVTGRTSTISGSKIITWSISPNIAGDYTIPPVAFSFYNPQSGTYSTLMTEPQQIKVSKGRSYEPVVAQKEKLTDLHPIASTPFAKFNLQGTPLLFTATYWSLYALPLLAFAGFLFWKRREDELTRDTVKLRNRRANKIAIRRLKNAERLLQQQSKGFYEEVSKAIWLYISDKLNIPLSSLSRERAYEALAARNVPQSLIDRVDQTITECETALYAPGAGSQQMQHTYQEAVTMISKLEECVKA